jgi:hypothetical protein
MIGRIAQYKILFTGAILFLTWTALSDLPLGHHGSPLELAILSLEAVLAAVMLLGSQYYLGVLYLAFLGISFVRF